jgi:hypothetical protein
MQLWKGFWPWRFLTTSRRAGPGRRLLSVSSFSGPAPEHTDAFLFGRVKRGLNKLQRQSRAELRQKAREQFWTEKQRREEESES